MRRKRGGAWSNLPRATVQTVAALGLLVVWGCATPFEAIDGVLARQARLALLQERPPPPEGEEEEEEMVEEAKTPTKSVLVAELLAIFPGLFWHGVGHWYAGDLKTAQDLREVGEFGYLFTALGAGLAAGGYFLDQSKSRWADNYVLSLYISGGVTGGIGVGLILTAWFYDMIDTPRAVRTGGRPPPSSPFSKDLREFGNR